MVENRLGPVPGFAREATVKYVDLSRGTMRVKFNLAKSDTVKFNEVTIPIPSAWAGPNGEFSGGCPAIGSTIWVSLGVGGQWAALMYASNTDTFGNSNTSSGTSFNRNLMSALKPGRWLTQVQNNIRLFADPKLGIQAGSPSDFLHIEPFNPASNKSIISYRFKQAMGFTEAFRNINGPIKRDLSSNSTRNITGSILDSHSYDDSLTTIGLDPLTKAGGSFNRNPPFVEVREVVYEFSNSFGFTNDEQEAAQYDNDNQKPSLSTKFPRRESRADAFSLSLSSPNYLFEAIKGTGVDVYGNLLDLNREKLPSGSVDELSFRSNVENKSQTFTKLREQARKGIALHFEMNARKAKVPDKNSILPSESGATDYARDRSRLFIDLDKEGQFKINIPASSEVGNIGLLTRYENYSTLKAAQDDSDPNEFIRNVDNKDIFLEGFGVGVINLTSGDQTLDGYAAPVDRVKNKPIKLGTAYHDLQKTLYLHNIGQDDTSINVVPFDPDNKLNDRSLVPLPGDIVSPKIIVSGEGANAGGRSGTINLDGHLSLNIGANTVDRQSLWLDCAGGIVSNVGRDLNNRSYQGRFDGDIFIAVGAETIGNDSRFNETNNASRDATVDIRVLSSGQMHIIRIDPSGMRIATPGEFVVEAAGNIHLKSKSDILLDGKGIYFYSDGTVPRWVMRKPGQTI